MTSFKKLLVPVDYSDYSREALRYAADLARSLQGEILLLHVVKPVAPATPAYVPPLAGYGILHKDMLDNARRYLDDLQPLMDGIPHRSLVRSGEAGDEIVAVARDEGVDVIVMATCGRSGLSRFLMGSTTEAVIRQATVPVMALRTALLAPKVEAVARA